MRGQQWNWATSSLLVAALVGAGLAGALSTTGTGRILFLAIACALAVVGRPILVVVLSLIVCQEISPAFGQTGLTVFGSQIYFIQPANLPISFYLLVLAAAVVAIRSSGLILHLDMRHILLIGFFAFFAWIVAIGHGLSLFSSFGQVLRPLLILALGWYLGARSASETTERVGAVSVGCAVVALAAAGLPAALAGGGLSLGGQLVYYDTATAAIAGAVLLSILREPGTSAARVLVGVSAAIVLLISFRRSVLISLIVIVLVTAIFSPALRKVLLRTLLAGSLLVFLGLVTVPSLLLVFWERVTASYDTLGGSAADSSTEGHVSDIAIGLSHALKNPWGYGPASPQLPGLVTEGGTIYVHNELLLNWLRFGFIGLVLMVLLLFVFSGTALKALISRTSRAPVVTHCAAYFILIFVLVSFTAPFLMSTSRWPALVGIAVGILSRPSLDKRRSSPVGPESPALRI